MVLVNNKILIYFPGYLTELDLPGHFEQVLTFLGQETNPVDYNVIW